MGTANDAMAAVADHDPERSLATAYAPAPARPGLTVLWQLDIALGAVVASTSEPMIGAIRLAWWREALVALDGAPAPAAPLLQAVAAILLPRGVTGAALAEIEGGWAPLLDGPEPDAAALADHARLRGSGVFDAAAIILGARPDGLTSAGGAGWALVDLARHSRDPAVAARALAVARVSLEGIAGMRWPEALRPLGMLAMLAARDAGAGVVGRQGAPARLLRGLRHRISGR